MKFNDLTLKKYIDIVDLETNEPATSVRGYKKIAIALGITYPKAVNKTIDEVNTILSNLNRPNQLPFNKYLFVGGKVLKAIMNLKDMKANQLIDFYSLVEKGAPYNDCLAVMYVPLFGSYKPDNHEKISKLLLKTKVSESLGLLFFWIDYSKKCEKHILTFLEKQAKSLEQEMTEIMTDKEFLHSYLHGGGNII